MTKMYCDFCGKEIKSTASLVTVTIESLVSRLGAPYEQELHFHMECGTRLRNKVNQFISQVRKER